MGSQTTIGLGPHAMWGCTPAIDLLQDAPMRRKVNILVCEPGDIGHALRTICTRRRHPHQIVHLYLWERQPEVLARHVLLLRVALDCELPLRQRASVFLEIFGNTLVQDRTSRYTVRLGKELMSNLFSMEQITDIADLSLLKSRERDRLAEIFKYWSSSIPCDIVCLRDCRLRHFFGARYDHRKNLVDWDYTNRLKNVASIVHYRQYRNWRLNGIAYEFGDQRYSQPNRTLISHAEGTMKTGRDRGSKKEVRGFWLDIRVGPFITFGVECDHRDKYVHDLLAVVNKGTGTEQHRHNTTEVSVYSLLSYFWELEVGRPYLMAKKDDIYSGLGEDGTRLDVPEGRHGNPQEASRLDPTVTCVNEFREDESHISTGIDGGQSIPGERVDDECQLFELSYQQEGTTDDKRGEMINMKEAAVRAQCILETLEGIKVHMLTGDIEQQLSRPRFARHFDRVHLSLLGADVGKHDVINQALAEKAIITVDTARYMIPFDKQQQHAFANEVCAMARDRGWRPLFDVVSTDDSRTYIPASNGALAWNSLRFSFDQEPVLG